MLEKLQMYLIKMILIFLGEQKIGGSEIVFKRSYESQRLELFNLNPSILIRHTFWSQVIGGYFAWMTMYGVSQTMVQR